MRVLKDEDGNYTVYLVQKFNCELPAKEEVVKLTKKTVLKLNRLFQLNLRGFYKVRVYLNRNIGYVLEIIKIDDISLGNLIDLRVLVYFDQDFYIGVEDYYSLPKQKKIIYLNDHFYVKVDELKDQEIFSLLEFGQLIYKTELLENFYLGKVIYN